jgi:type II secretory pathway pseudopilin PulG
MKNTGKRGEKGFTTVEIIVALVLFSAATAGVLLMGKAMRDHRTAAATASQQNAYATFQSQIALQGINPALVGNPLQSVVNQRGTTGTTVSLGSNTSMQIVRNVQASFEVSDHAVGQPVAAQRNLAGSARVDAVTYNAASAGAQATRGASMGFGIETTGLATTVNAIPLAPPTFNIQGDLTGAAFPLNDIATLPSTNPPGTTYRYTLDGSVPTASSPIWDNNPDWTQTTFPQEVALRAFNSDQQYAPSATVTATYSMQLSVSFGRADDRTSNLYGFTLADLSSAQATGVTLTENVPGFTILYTLDGSNPTASPTAASYSGPFVPLQAQFGPTVPLEVAAVSTDPRYVSAPTALYTLTTITVPLQPPTFITPNTQPLSPGSSVVISDPGSGASPRTAVNNGSPTQNSSSATSFPLN